MAKNLGNAIKVDNKSSVQDPAKPMIFLRYHLDKILKDDYLTVKDPLEIWQALADRFAHQKPLFYLEHDMNGRILRLQNFKSVTDFQFR